MLYPATVLAGVDTQAVVQAVLDPPVLAGQFEQAAASANSGPQAGNEPDGLCRCFDQLVLMPGRQGRFPPAPALGGASATCGASRASTTVLSALAARGDTASSRQ